MGSEHPGNKSGSDHGGEFRIGGRDQVKLQYTMGEVDMSANKAATQLKESKQLTVSRLAWPQYQKQITN